MGFLSGDHAKKRSWLFTLVRELVTTLLCVVLVGAGYKYVQLHVFKARDTENEIKIPKDAMLGIGHPFNLDGVKFAGHPITLVMITSPKCVYCRRSIPFHQALLASADAKSIPAYVLVPNVHEAQEYLRSSGLSKAHVVDWAAVHTRFTGTPTLIMIDSVGVIQRVWIGMVGSSERRQEIQDILLGKRPLQNVASRLDSGEPNLTIDSLVSISRSQSVRVIDVRTRALYADSHVADAVNIPFDELTQRVPFELNKSYLNVVDCSALSTTRCSSTVKLLERRGFAEVAALNWGVGFQDACRVSPAQSAEASLQLDSPK